MWRHHAVWWSSRCEPSPTWTQAAFAFCLAAWRIDEQRRFVLVARRAAPAGDVAVDVEHLPGGEPYRRRDFLGRDAVIERVHAPVQRGERDAEEELLLRLREGIGVRGRRPAADLLGDAEVRGELIHL